MSARFLAFFFVIGALLLGAATPAAAHDITGTGDSIPEFLWMGVEHMVLGFDHLLFALGVVLLAGQVRRAAGLISLFALGHSVTLIAATLAEVSVSPRRVDIIIALSVAFVGVVGLFARPRTPAHWRWFGAAVLVFGLIHGLGLSTRLQQADVSSVSGILAFNVGIELGQLAVIAACVLVGRLVAYVAPGKVPGRMARRLGNVGLVLAGLVLAGLLVAQRWTEPVTNALANAV
ncbi:HupE/UreJ family protein [Luedemannella helvata]|uniref:HupE/UreJ family protein n=1 Tax=Luedemannella helvata TaxID=349315 RepID=A0ABP4XDI3_9ACTN